MFVLETARGLRLAAQFATRRRALSENDQGQIVGFRRLPAVVRPHPLAGELDDGIHAAERAYQDFKSKFAATAHLRELAHTLE